MNSMQYEHLPVFKREKDKKMARGFLGNSNFFVVGTQCFDVATVMYLSKTAEHLTPRRRCIADHVTC